MGEDPNSVLNSGPSWSPVAALWQTCDGLAVLAVLKAERRV